VAAKAATKAKERQGRKDPFPKATAAAAAGPFVPYSNGMGRGGTLFGLDAIYVTPHFRMVTVPVCIRHSHPITALDMTPRTAAVCRANDVDPDWLRIRDFHSFHADSGEVDVQERGRRFQHWNERRDYMFKVRGVKRGSERREAEPTAVCGVRRENRGEGPNLLRCLLVLVFSDSRVPYMCPNTNVSSPPSAPPPSSPPLLPYTRNSWNKERWPTSTPRAPPARLS
jgi:hypothetical protein